MNGWFQSADSSVEDANDVSLDWALREYSARDWASDHASERRLDSEGATFCSPGMGLVDPDGPRILHLCPLADGIVMVHFHYPTPPETGWIRKLFSGRQMTKFALCPHADAVPRLMELHYAGYVAALADYMDELAAT